MPRLSMCQSAPRPAHRRRPRTILNGRRHVGRRLREAGSQCGRSQLRRLSSSALTRLVFCLRRSYGFGCHAFPRIGARYPARIPSTKGAHGGVAIRVRRTRLATVCLPLTMAAAPSQAAAANQFGRPRRAASTHSLAGTGGDCSLPLSQPERATPVKSMEIQGAPCCAAQYIPVSFTPPHKLRIRISSEASRPRLSVRITIPFASRQATPFWRHARDDRRLICRGACIGKS